MGTGKVELQLVYDTASDWLVIPSSDCSNCEGSKYDRTTSTNSADGTSGITSRLYGSASFEGATYTDDVCI